MTEETWVTQGSPLGASPEMTEDEKFLAIVQERAKPEAIPHQAGRDARAAGLGFHECPYHPFYGVAALSWRIGWNERALEFRDK